MTGKHVADEKKEGKTIQNRKMLVRIVKDKKIEEKTENKMSKKHLNL